MSENNVVIMGEHANDNRLITVEQLLELALADLRTGKLKATAVAVIFQEEEECTFEVYAAQMSRADLIVAFTVLLARNVARYRGREQ